MCEVSVEGSHISISEQEKAHEGHKLADLGFSEIII
jgi:hypothetical protein